MGVSTRDIDESFNDHLNVEKVEKEVELLDPSSKRSTETDLFGCMLWHWKLPSSIVHYNSGSGTLPVVTCCLLRSTECCHHSKGHRRNHSRKLTPRILEHNNKFGLTLEDLLWPTVPGKNSWGDRTHITQEECQTTQLFMYNLNRIVPCRIPWTGLRRATISGRPTGVSSPSYTALPSPRHPVVLLLSPWVLSTVVLWGGGLR